jgi:hypothetical protein
VTLVNFKLERRVELCSYRITRKKMKMFQFTVLGTGIFTETYVSIPYDKKEHGGKSWLNLCFSDFQLNLNRVFYI